MFSRINFIRFIIYELLIVLSFHFLVPVSTDKVITGDGLGYYDYLPSIFIYHDFVRLNIDEKEKVGFQNRTKNLGFYSQVSDQWVNRYPCGTALLELPFFLAGKWIQEQNGSLTQGYEPIYHKVVGIAALFFLLLALIYIRSLLKLYHVRWFLIFYLQLLLVFSTTITQYATANAAFSHIYSLFAITAFLFYTKKFFEEFSSKSFWFAAFFLGLIFIIRNVNIIIVLIIPFLAGSRENLKLGSAILFNKSVVLFKGVFICFCVCFIQLAAWYLQSGRWFVYSYDGYGFNFLDPYFVKILFSYRKGLFVYTPVLLFGVVGVIAWLLKADIFRFLSWVFFFCILTYILSSWEIWYYGDSYGLRAFVDFYPVFFVPFAILLEKSGTISRAILIFFSMFTIPLNMVQTFQYQKYIIHHNSMDRQDYWKVFLKTDERYFGLPYAHRKTMVTNNVASDFSLGNIHVRANEQHLIWSMDGRDFLTYSNVWVIQIEFNNQFSDTDWSQLALTIDDSEGNNKLFCRPYLLQFATQRFNKEQKGYFNFRIPAIDNISNTQIRFILCTAKHPCEMEDVHVRFITKD